jgi:hypothetical protein
VYEALSYSGERGLKLLVYEALSYSGEELEVMRGKATSV